MVRHTLLEGVHGKQTREHALVVAVEDTTEASKGGNSQDLPVLHQGPGTGGAHELLASLQRGIVDAGRGDYSSAHC
jgi:hypothetical protein